MPDVNALPETLRPHRPFRAAVLRGLGGLIPPLMTVVVLLWALGIVRRYVWDPLERGATGLLTEAVARTVVREHSPRERADLQMIDGAIYKRASDGRFVPEYIYATVAQEEGRVAVESYTSRKLCSRYVQLVFMRPYYVIPMFLALFLLGMYFLGKVLTRRVTQLAWLAVERLIRRVPLLRNVYSSIKQVTEFLLRRGKLLDARIVAVPYPRENMWTLGYVTGDGLQDITDAAGERMVSVLMDTSPVPFNGFTCVVPEREVIPLDLSMNQALQYVISCGVVAPRRALTTMARMCRRRAEAQQRTPELRR
jgi:uncharacterized membrane protein